MRLKYLIKFNNSTYIVRSELSYPKYYFKQERNQKHSAPKQQHFLEE